MKVISETKYNEVVNGISWVSGKRVEVIGEADVEFEGGVVTTYVYNIVGEPAKNGKPYFALKSNIVIPPTYEQ